MNKKTFKNLVKQELSNKSIKQQLNIINKMYGTTRESLSELSKEIRDNCVYCRECDNYYPKKDLKVIERVETVTEPTYIDAGYGDDDKMGEVEYYMTYQICPKNSKHEILAKRSYIRIIREWDRCAYKS